MVLHQVRHLEDNFVRFLQFLQFRIHQLCNMLLVKNNIKILLVLLLSAMSGACSKSNNKNNNYMKLNAGIITSKLAECKSFYTETLGFGITFENEFYLLMHTPDKLSEISFLQPNHPTQQTIFQQEFQGKGVYLTIEVNDVDAIYKVVKSKGIPISVELRDEPWGDRHFAITDPNGIGIDIVKYIAPE